MTSLPTGETVMSETTAEQIDSGTRLMLWNNIGCGFIAMGAAGWHISLDVLDHFLAGNPIGRIVGGDAMKFDGWKRLHAEYVKQFNLDEMDGNG